MHIVAHEINCDSHGGGVVDISVDEPRSEISMLQVQINTQIQTVLLTYRSKMGGSEEFMSAT
jgi:hypothetical protein